MGPLFFVVIQATIVPREELILESHTSSIQCCLNVALLFVCGSDVGAFVCGSDVGVFVCGSDVCVWL